MGMSGQDHDLTAARTPLLWVVSVYQGPRARAIALPKLTSRSGAVLYSTCARYLAFWLASQASLYRTSTTLHHFTNHPEWLMVQQMFSEISACTIAAPSAPEVGFDRLLRSTIAQKLETDGQNETVSLHSR
jgi:hypothetical protein